MQNKQIVIIGSNSIHTLRYFYAVCKRVNKSVIFITNDANGIDIINNAIIYSVIFTLKNLRASRQIATILNKYHADIVHIHQANSYAYHSIRAIRTMNIQPKIILTTWGSDILILPHKNAILKRMVKYNLSHADIITSDSLYMSSQIRNLLTVDKDLRTINFGMQNFPDAIDLANKQDIILSNRLHKPLYRIDKIILAYAKFIAENPKYAHYKLVVAASGELTASLQEFAKQLGLSSSQIVFTGTLTYKELQEWYKIAKIFVSIPESDATSLSVLEAMGNGCYPVLSNLPANLEWVIDQINGKICQSVNNLAYDLQYAVNAIENHASYNELAEFNYKLIAKKAVFETNLDKFLRLYT